jgi:hypothetical protein
MLDETLRQDDVWYKNVRVLADHPSEIIPTRDQSDAERINALVRLVAYCSLAVSLLRENPMYVVLGLAIIAIISLTFSIGQKKQRNESYGNLRPDTVKREKKSCSSGSPNNPFSNATVGALLDDEGRPPACSYDTPGVANTTRKNFNRGLFRNLDDVYEVENSQRQFYTMPVTTSAPDTIAFAEFAYGSRGATCKETNSMCTPAFATRDG